MMTSSWGVWRPGTGGQKVQWGLTLDEFKAKEIEYREKKGRRLQILKAKRFTK